MKSTRFKFDAAQICALATLVVPGAFSPMVLGDAVKVTLSRDTEVPPVKTMASGSGTITVNADMTVSGGVATTGVAATDRRSACVRTGSSTTSTACGRGWPCAPR